MMPDARRPRSMTPVNPGRERRLTMELMARILIAYSTYDGQTAAIARRMAQVLQAAGSTVSVRSIADPATEASLADSEVVLLGAAIRFGGHGAAVEAWVGDHLPDLASRSSAFFSVSLSAGGPGANPAQAGGYNASFVERAHCAPQPPPPLCGPVSYTRY